jgi:hypothetical protein
MSPNGATRLQRCNRAAALGLDDFVNNFFQGFARLAIICRQFGAIQFPRDAQLQSDVQPSRIAQLLPFPIPTPCLNL